MEACLTESKGRGCDTLWLGVWEKNGRAIAFYREVGLQASRLSPFPIGRRSPDGLDHAATRGVFQGGVTTR